MAPESEHKQAHHNEKGNEHSQLADQQAADTPAPESFVSGLDTLQRSLQDIAGERFQLSINPEMRAQNLLALQHTVGNQSVQRAIQRQNTPAPAPAVTPPSGLPATPSASLPQDLVDFRARGAMPAAAAGTPITAGGGGFNARYDPTGMALTITLNLGMNFIDGMRISGNRVTATQGSMSSSAIQINEALSRLSGERLTRGLAWVREQWTWTGASDPRITTWMADYRANVMGAWSSTGASGGGSGIIFQGSRAGWDTQLARVNVVVNTQNITSLAAGTPIPGPQPVHCRADIYKTPDADLFGARVFPGTPATPDANRTPGRLELGSGQITRAGRRFALNNSVYFDNNSSTLNAEARDTLRKWIFSFQAAPGAPGDSISITGRASTAGNTTEAGTQRNARLSFDRATAVEHFLKTTSVDSSLLRNAATRIDLISGIGAAGAGEEAQWRRVDIVVGTGQGQNLAAHEFGHMIGLGDEYATTPNRGLITGTGGDVGTTASHNQVATDMGLGGSVHENNDNIMSLGSTIRPQHYATFMSALHTVTGVNDWRVKP